MKSFLEAAIPSEKPHTFYVVLYRDLNILLYKLQGFCSNLAVDNAMVLKSGNERSVYMEHQRPEILVSDLNPFSPHTTDTLSVRLIMKLTTLENVEKNLKAFNNLLIPLRNYLDLSLT